MIDHQYTVAHLENPFVLIFLHLVRQNQLSSESEIKFVWLVDIMNTPEDVLFYVQSNIDVVTIKLLEYFRLHLGWGQVQSHYVYRIVPSTTDSMLSGPSSGI